jgi:hypothetical protein
MLDASEEQQLQKDSPYRCTIKEKMEELGWPREGVILDSPATECIVPLQSTLDSGKDRRSTTKNLQSVSPNTMFPTE